MPDLTMAEDDLFSKTAHVVADEMALKHGNYHFTALSVINDDPSNTEEQLAKWFENTIKRMGYDIS